MSTEQLSEAPRVRQIPGEAKRRWFTSSEIDLIVWLDKSNQPFSFQLCYKKAFGECALTWEAGKGFNHSSVDSGEGNGYSHKGAPILRHDVNFEREYVSVLFAKSSTDLPPDLLALVTEAIDRYPNSPDITARRPDSFPRTKLRRSFIAQLQLLLNLLRTRKGLFWGSVFIAAAIFVFGG